MSKPLTILLVVIILALVGVLTFLATWSMPAPKAPFERTLPSERFPG
jgi:hypothetical protein